jgi:hypothetical protein
VNGRSYALLLAAQLAFLAFRALTLLALIFARSRFRHRAKISLPTRVVELAGGLGCGNVESIIVDIHMA